LVDDAATEAKGRHIRDNAVRKKHGCDITMLQKKSRHSSKDVLPDLGEVLHNLKPSEFKDKYLSRYKVLRTVVIM